MASPVAILMLTSWSERVDAGRIVDDVGVDACRPPSAALDAAALGEAEIGALADHLGAQVVGVDAHGVVGAVAGIGVGSRSTPSRRCRCRRTRADRPAPPGWRASGRPASVLAASMPSTALRLGRERDRLGGAVVDAAARARSASCRSPSRTSAAGRTGACARPSSRRVGVGSMKMWRWSKAASSLMCCDSSMPLPNTSPDMSPTPTTVKGVRLDVDAELAEVALDRLPGAARGDAHLLVVVAGRAARGEGVVEPEAVVARRARWRCRRRWRCPCRPRRRDRDRRRRGARRSAGGRTPPST